jgi:competence protein ComEC
MATRKTIIVITFFCFLFLILSIPADAKTSTSDNDHLKIHFINVGQGDAIFIQTPKGKTVLIDSGSDLTKRKVISYLKFQGVKTLNLVIVNHPHPDHIGAMPDILKEFKVDTFYMADLKDETPLFTNLQKVIIDQGIFVFRPHLDEALELEKDLVFKFIAPTLGNYESLNEYSSVIQVTYKKNRFLLMADAGEQSEADE